MAATIQFIVTWRRRCPAGELRVHVQETDDDEQVDKVLDGLAKTDHGLVAISLAERVVSRMGGRDLTEPARARVRIRLNGMKSFEGLVRGAKVFAMCLDRSQYATPPVLYTQPVPDEFGMAHADPRMMDDTDWRGLAEQIDERLWTEKVRAQSVRDVEALTGILRELMRNTDHWARSDEHGRRYGAQESVRGFRLETLSFKAERQAGGLDAEGPLAAYFAHPGLTDGKGQRRFVELAVFDSGPGLAARLLCDRSGDKPASRAAESAAVQECIRKWVTSSGEGHRGQGLAEVVRLANQAGGFLRIRSGRTSFYRDYMADPCDEGGDDVEVRPWAAEAVPEAVGTSLVAILPVVRDA